MKTSTFILALLGVAQSHRLSLNQFAWNKKHTGEWKADEFAEFGEGFDSSSTVGVGALA